MNFEKKVAVITGGAAGIGRATCREFHRRGATVVIVDISKKGGESTAAKIVRDGGRAMFIAADVSREEDVAAIPVRVVETFGRIDVLVNNAGVPHSGTVLDDSPDVWDRVCAVNLRGAYLCSHFILPELLKRSGASIVNVGSVQSCFAAPRSAAYVASKSGLLGLTRAMAVDHAPRVRVNAVLPGSVDTALFRTGLPVGPAAAKLISDISAKCLLGRIGRAAEVAEVIVFLASEGARFITGTSLLVDGGLTAKV